MPFPIKALKLVLSELQSDGEPASLSYGGVGLRDVQGDRDAESDDGVSNACIHWYERALTSAPLRMKTGRMKKGLRDRSLAAL